MLVVSRARPRRRTKALLLITYKNEDGLVKDRSYGYYHTLTANGGLSLTPTLLSSQQSQAIADSVLLCLAVNAIKLTGVINHKVNSLGITLGL